MRLEPLAPGGVFLGIPEPIGDHRGFFARVFSRTAFESLGLVTDFPEWSLSFNQRKGTLRGLHWQAEPVPETKLVQCVAGAIFDVAVDIRPASPTFGRWCAAELSAENRRFLYIPAGFAHGFQTLTDQAEVLYHISQVYRPELARGLRWDDPDIAVDWPECDDRVMSERDRALPLLSTLGERP